ncbi:MAG: hypothetical protein NZ553_03425 [Caldilinea sp.]|nr:hypothetical protein [Caldilinea sp.]MDW8439502.1 hypothetical protein [Caldilineaceae bacterium]
MKGQSGPMAHCVFVIRAWRVNGEMPWEFIVHRSGSNEIEYAIDVSELATAIDRQLAKQPSTTTDLQIAA